MEVIIPGNMAAADTQFASVRHGIASIDDQVGKHLADLVGGDHGVWKHVQLRLHFHVGTLELAVQQQQGVFNNGIYVDRLDLLSIAIQTEHLAHNARHAFSFRLQDVVYGRCIIRNRAGQQINCILDGFHGVVDLMGNSGGQPAGGGKLLNFQHAPLYLQLFDFAQSGQVAQDGNGICNLAALAIDFAGARIIVDLLPECWIVEPKRRGFAVRERRCKRVDERRKLSLVLELDCIAHQVSLSAEKLLGQWVHQDDLGFAVADHNGVAYVFNDQVQAVAVLPHNFFSFTQPFIIQAQFLVGTAEISHVTHHGYGAKLDAFRPKGGGGDGFKQHFFAFNGVYQREIAMGITAGNQHGRKRGGKKQVIEFNGAHQAFSHLLRDAEEALSSLILHDDAMLRVSEDDRIGHALHHCAHLRNGDFHITHAVVIMLNFEEP